MKADGSNGNGGSGGNNGGASTAVARRESNRTIKDILASDYVKGRFADVMGAKAPAFVASILNAVRLNPTLGKCDPMSVVGSAMVAASLDLPIDSSLGFAAIVPYNDKDRGLVAQFQIMTKGFVQLALRSGQYKTMHAGPIYEDEFKGYNIITGDVYIEPVEDGYRAQEREDKVVGYVAFFRLLNGFEKTVFWSMKRIDAHGKRYSKSFDKKYGQWNTDKPAMAQKTVLKHTISHWGPLSTTMQMAMTTDQAVIRDIENPEESVSYVDNPNGESDVDESPITESDATASEAKTAAEVSKPAAAASSAASASAATPAKEASKEAPSKQSAPPAGGEPEIDIF